MSILPGDLVVPRIRFGLKSRRVGLVVGSMKNAGLAYEWLVMWIQDGEVQFTRHMDNGLLRVDASTISKIKERLQEVSL